MRRAIALATWLLAAPALAQDSDNRHLAGLDGEDESPVPVRPWAVEPYWEPVSHLAGQFVTESGLVGALGGLIGGAAGLLVTLAVAASRQWTPVFDARLAAGAPALGLVIGIAAGAFPAWRAARIEPITALRSALSNSSIVDE